VPGSSEEVIEAVPAMGRFASAKTAELVYMNLLLFKSTPALLAEAIALLSFA
jgi:hypothetical protein